MQFEWDEDKNNSNQAKHGISFDEAQYAFYDEHRVIAKDKKHSDSNETRYFCFGLVSKEILTVRFTMRGNSIRIFGAGYWREGRKRYEEKNNL